VLHEQDSMLRKLPIIGVLGQGTPISAGRAQLARQVGAMVARLGAHLLTGGGYGVMAAAAEGFTEREPRRGLSLGIVPRDPDGPLDRVNHDVEGRPYPNPFIEIAIITPLPPRAVDWLTVPARNHINIFTADALIALPGSTGTRNELDMAATYRGERDVSPAQRRTVLIGPAAEFSAEHCALFVHAASVEAAEQHLRRVIETHGFSSHPESRP
jgi:uncharacterized protein (TIGR00725 family)